VNALIELIKALTPFVASSMPVLLLLGGWWIKKQNDKAAADNQKAMVAQTAELKAHSDENREKTLSALASVSGTFKAMPAAKADGP